MSTQNKELFCSHGFPIRQAGKVGQKHGGQINWGAMGFALDAEFSLRCIQVKSDAGSASFCETREVPPPFPKEHAPVAAMTGHA